MKKHIRAVRRTSKTQVEEALRISEEKYRALVENANDVHFSLDAEGRFTYISPVIVRFAHYQDNEVIGKPFTHFVHPDDLPGLRASFTKTLTGDMEPFEFRIFARDGSVLHVRTSSRPLLEGGQLVGLTGVMVDITERKRAEEALQRAHAELERRVDERTADLAQANRMLNILSECNQAVVRAMEEPALLQDICRILVERGGYSLAWVGFAEQDAGQTVRPVAQAGFEDGYLNAAHLTWADGEQGWAPAGIAIRSGQACIARNIQTDPQFAPWRDEAIRCGFASSMALPLFGDEGVFGALNLYAAAPDAFGPEETELLMELAGDLAFGVTSLRERAARRRAEEQLQRLADLQSAILDNAAYVVVSTDREGVITTFNPAAVRTLGYTAEECIGKLTPVAFHDLNEIAERAREFSAELGVAIEPGFEVFAEKARRNLPNEYEWTFIRKDGVHIPVLLSVTALRDAHGEITGFLGIAGDITHQKQAEDALWKSSQMLKLVLDNMPSFVFWKDLNSVYLGCNDLFAANAGLSSPEEIIGLTDLDLPWKYAEAESYRADDRLVMDGGIPKINYEETQLTADGRITDVRTSKIPLRDPEGAVIGVVGTFEDITERKRAERELRAANQRLSNIIDFLPDATFVIDQDKKVIAWNRAMEEMTGARKEDMLGQGDYAYAIPLYGDRRPVFIDFIEAENPEFQSKYEYVRKQGNRLYGEVFLPSVFGGRGAYLWVTASPLLDGEGKQVGAIESMRDITERKQDEKARETLYEISQAAISADKLEDLYHSIHEILSGLMPAENFFIALYDPSNDLLSYPYFVDQFDAVPPPERPGRSLTGYVLRTGRATLASPEVFAALIEAGEVGLIGSPPIDWLGVPLKAKSRVIGVMAVQSYSEHVRYGKKDLDIMEFVSTQVAMAIERKRSFEEIQQNLERLNALRAIDLALTSSFDLRLNLSVLLEQVLIQLAVDAADVLLLNPYTLALEYTAGRGFRTGAVESAQIRLGESFAGIVALERRTIQLNDPAQIQESPQFAALWAGEGAVAYYAVPLIAKGQVKGVLEIFHRAPLAAEQNWVRFLEALAGQAAIAIENAQLFEHLQRSNMDLALAYDATIEGWARAIDLRDKETEGHTRRVSELTERLARALGMSEAEIVHARRGAILHDIGKMGVPDRILHKPTTLTEEEWVIMRRHPQFAFDMLARIAFLRPALDIPYCHHEKWDGSGYPRGLQGEQIPLAARLFAVIDVYDALVSDRLYRAAWSREDTLRYIESLAGTHFDPKVVEMFMKQI